MIVRTCSRCDRPFDHHRKREDVCPSCRSGDAPAALFIDHRLNVVAVQFAPGVVSAVIASLAAEGFVLAAPGSALVPAEWLLGLRRLLNPEDLTLDTVHPFTVAGYQAVEDHVRSLPAVQAITTTTGEPS